MERGVNVEVPLRLMQVLAAYVADVTGGCGCGCAAPGE
jgi:hypothetical protein